MANPRIGFIGIGEMGDPMVRNLLRAKFSVTVYDLAKAKTAGVAKAGAQVARSNAELAAVSDVVIVMVDTTEAARSALFGTGGVWETIRPGSTVILMSSIDPFFCQHVAEEGKKKKVHVLDVPVSGAGEPVKEGTLTMFCGGDKAVMTKHKLVLMAMGDKLFHMGGPGMGAVAKICNNYIVTVTSAVLADTIRIASRAGVDLDTLRAALSTSSAASESMRRNWHSFAKEAAPSGTKVVKRSPRNLYKDLRLTMDLAARHGLFVPLAGVASQLDLSRWRPPSDK